MDIDTPALTWAPSPPRMWTKAWPWPLPVDLQNVIMSSVVAGEYSLSVLSKRFEPFMRYLGSGNNIWQDERDSLKTLYLRRHYRSGGEGVTKWQVETHQQQVARTTALCTIYAVSPRLRPNVMPRRWPFQSFPVIRRYQTAFVSSELLGFCF